MGEDPEESLPAFRRLFYTLPCKSFRTGARPAQHFSMPKQVDRLDRVGKSLPGLTIDTGLEPPRSLVEKAISFAEEQCLGPLELSKCTSRIGNALGKEGPSSI